MRKAAGPPERGRCSARLPNRFSAGRCVGSSAIDADLVTGWATLSILAEPSGHTLDELAERADMMTAAPGVRRVPIIRSAGQRERRLPAGAQID
jgi:hypothetical protein